MHDKGECIKNLHPGRMVLHKIFYAPGGVDKKVSVVFVSPLVKIYFKCEDVMGRTRKGGVLTKKVGRETRTGQNDKKFQWFFVFALVKIYLL